METAKYNMSIQSGESVNRQFKLLTANGVPYDLTGFTIQSFVKPDYTSSAAATFTCTSPDPTNGIINLSLDSGSSGALTGSCYYYDVRLILGATVSYPVEGKVIASPSITKN